MIVRIDEKEPASTAGVRWPRVCSTFSCILSSQETGHGEEERKWKDRGKEKKLTHVYITVTMSLRDKSVKRG